MKTKKAPKPVTLAGYELRFERRRYGDATYTWVEYRWPGDAEWQSTGDPWPCLNPSRGSIAKVILDRLRAKIEAHDFLEILDEVPVMLGHGFGVLDRRQQLCVVVKHETALVDLLAWGAERYLNSVHNGAIPKVNNA